MTGARPSIGCLMILALTLVSAAPPEGDRLRNVAPGEPLPPFKCATLDGKVVASEDVAGKVLVLVYLRSRHKASEQAQASAHRVIAKLGAVDLRLVFMTRRDDQEAQYFRELRERLEIQEPLALDAERKHYGKLGLFVYPTTIVSSKDGRLLHVFSSWTRDYEQFLDLYCRHALGQVDDAELSRRLNDKKAGFKDEARAIANRHRKVAAKLRSKGLLDNALKELDRALTADPKCGEAVLELAEILIAQDKLDQAAARLDGLLKRAPDFRGVKLTVGLLELKRGQLDQAEGLLKESLLRRVDPIRAHYYLGQLYEAKGEYQAAMEHYRAALERSLAKN